MKTTVWRVLLTLATLSAPATEVLAQDYPGRAKLRAQSNEFRREITRSPTASTSRWATRPAMSS